MSEKIEYIWQTENTGQRLDKILAVACDVSRTQIQRWIEDQCVTLSGKPVSTKTKLKTGDVLCIIPPPVQSTEIKPEEMPLDVLFEDKDIIVLNKKAGDVVHPGAGVSSGTLVSALLHHCKGELSGIGGVERPGIVHRLDKDTSGVLVVAKNDSAHQALSEQFQNRTMIKIYLAYVSGVPHAKMGSWKWPIIRHAVHRHKMTALKNPSDAEKGRHALTDYCVKKSWKRTSQLELRLHTGRTHQIRVHSATAGHSVIGDAVYGKPAPWWKEASVTRQLLHAHKLKLEHRRKTVEFIAPVPDDFTAFENWLNQHES